MRFAWVALMQKGSQENIEASIAVVILFQTIVRYESVSVSQAFLWCFLVFLTLRHLTNLALK